MDGFEEFHRLVVALHGGKKFPLFGHLGGTRHLEIAVQPQLADGRVRLRFRNFGGDKRTNR